MAINGYRRRSFDQRSNPPHPEARLLQVVLVWDPSAEPPWKIRQIGGIFWDLGRPSFSLTRS